MRKFHLLASAAIMMALSSCGSKSSKIDFEYFPVQMEQGEVWSLISPSGKVLVQDEFKEKPTLVVNGRFMVRNSEGLWEIYTADEKPQKIGGEYKSAGLFVEDVAPVAEKGKPVQLIDRDGKVKVTLDKIDGKTVASVSNFTDGLAVFTLEEGGQGCINTKGEVVVPAKFNDIRYIGDGKMFATKIATGDTENDDMGAESTILVLDHKGNELFNFPEGKYTPSSSYENGRAVVTVPGEDGGIRYGIIDDKGEWILKPSSKIQYISERLNDLFIFGNDSGFGLMNIEGEVLLRAKYDILNFANDETLIATRRSSQGTESMLIDLEGNKIENTTYDETLSKIDNKHLIACESHNSYIIIGLKGENIDKKLSFCNYDLSSIGDWVVESDYVDIQALTNAMLDAKGPAGISPDDNATDIMKRLEIITDDMLNFTDDRDLKGYFSATGTIFESNVVYAEKPLGEEYTDRGLKPLYVDAVVQCDKKLSDKWNEIYNALKQKLDGVGGEKIVEEDGLVIYRKGQRNYAVGHNSRGNTHKVGIAVFEEGQYVSQGWWAETTLDRFKKRIR